MSKKYLFKKQLNNKGCYVEINYDADFWEGGENEISIKYLAEQRWALSTKLGIHLFNDYYKRFNTGRLSVTIYEIKWVPVDTNNLVVLFASIKALCDALNFEIKGFRFDSDGEMFNFPELRSIGF